MNLFLVRLKTHFELTDLVWDAKYLSEKSMLV